MYLCEQDKICYILATSMSCCLHWRNDSREKLLRLLLKTSLRNFKCEKSLSIGAVFENGETNPPTNRHSCSNCLNKIGPTPR